MELKCETYPIIEAVRSNNINLVKILLANNTDINIENKQGESPIDIAYENKNIELVRILSNYKEKLKSTTNQ